MKEVIKKVAEKPPLAIKWFNQPYSLNEISQSTGYVFSFLSSTKDGSKQCHPWVKCRDFLHDAVRSQKTGLPCSIFGFTYNPSKPEIYAPIDMRRMRMMVSQNGTLTAKEEATALTEFHLQMRFAKRLVNYFERIMGVGYSKLSYYRQDGKNVWIFNGPAIWLSSPVLVSMYTYLIRLGHKKLQFKDEKELVALLKEVSVGSDNDANYMKAFVGADTNKLLIMAKNASKLSGGNCFSSDISIGTYHNNGGIVSFCSNTYLRSNEGRELAKSLLEGKNGNDTKEA